MEPTAPTATAAWTPKSVKLLAIAAADPAVDRIFVNPGIKRMLCEGPERKAPWTARVRPWWGHHDHFHVRLECPPGMATCIGQSQPPAGDGCGAELTEWFKPKPPPKPPTKPVKPVKPPPPLTLAGLPKACTDVLYAKDAPLVAGESGGSDALGKLIGRDETGASISK